MVILGLGFFDNSQHKLHDEIKSGILSLKLMSTDTLQLRRIAIDTYHENVAYLHRECGVYRAEGFQALSKIQVSINSSKVLAVLNVVDDAAIVLPGELGLSEQAFTQLNAEAGSLVTVNHAEPPKSMDAVRRKINGERLDQDDFRGSLKIPHLTAIFDGKQWH